MATNHKYWFRKWLAAKPFCSFVPWTTHSCKTKRSSTNTKKVEHYKLFRKNTIKAMYWEENWSDTSTSIKKINKEKEVKIEAEGKTEEKKNKEDDRSTRKLEGSATYRCKFDKEWSKKNPCIQPVKEDPHAFFCTICSKKVSCSHQAFCDVVRHCKTALHIKFKDEMNRQHKIEKPDDLLKKKYLCLNLDCSVINFDC